MGQAIEQALAAGLEEALDRRRVAQRVGRRHRLGQQADDELAAADVFRRQVAVGHPVLQFPAPGQVGLHVAAVQRVVAPGRVGETAVFVARAQFRGAEQHVLQFDAEAGRMLGAVERLPDRLQQHHTGRSKQILAAHTDHRIEVQGAFRGLLGQSVVVLLGHRRCSMVLRPIPADCISMHVGPGIARVDGSPGASLLPGQQQCVVVH
ncbi:hypothetical protein D9M70_542360 [compost metagenome]